MTTRAQLLTAIRMSGRELVEACRALPTEHFDAGVYENGWNGRQLLAHVAAIEWSYPNLIEVANAAGAGAGEPPRRQAEGGMDAYNARQVAKRASATIPELIAEFERNRARTLAAVEGIPQDLLDRELTSAGGIRGTLADVLLSVAAEHVRGHLADSARPSTPRP